jgi:hypothetical protein
MPFHLYGLMTKMEFVIVASPLKQPHHPHDARQQQPEHDAGHDWEIEAVVLPLHCDVTRQPAEPRDRWRNQPDHADHDDDQSHNDQCPSGMLYHFFLPLGFLT